MIDALSLNPEELAREVEKLSIEKYRAKQIFDWLHLKKVESFSSMSNIPESVKKALSENFYIGSLNAIQRLESKIDPTVKYLYEMADKQRVETVFMSHNRGNSLCISTQVGCKMNCEFCASGKSGFVRNLTPSEMLLQLRETERDYKNEKAIDSLVLMGIGEPLDNFDNVLKFLELLRLGGFSLRRVSLSTCGLADKIDELSKLKLGLTLSVSLHASNDETRSALMPVNKRYNLERLLNSCSKYFKETGRRISYEYALISGVNDKEQDALSLARLLKKHLPANSYHVNLIPANSISGVDFKKSGFEKSPNAGKFSEILIKERVNATIRRTLGADINAACGQLRNSAETV